MSIKLVSIVVCTHRRPQLLKLALQSIAEQTAPPETFEVVVVDNDNISSQEIAHLVGEHSSGINVHYIHEEKIGLSHARNTGGKAANSEYVFYLDDDAKLPTNYLKVLIEVMEREHPEVVGGPFYPYYLTPKPVWYKDQYGTGYDYGACPLFLEHTKMLSGSNIIMQKNLLETTGWFNPAYGMTGNKTWYGEETELQIRAWKQNPNLSVFYDPRLFIHHLVPARKMSVAWSLRMAYALGRSQAHLFDQPGQPGMGKLQAVFNLFRILTRLILKTPFELLLRDRASYPYWQNFIYERTSRSFSGIGQALWVIAGDGSEKNVQISES